MNKRKLRVAWCSNHPEASSGYSQQTQDLKRMFLKSGWDKDNFALINMFGQLGFKAQDKDGVWNYPIMDHAMGSDAMLYHGKHFNADIVIGLFDLWVQNPQDLAQIPRFIPFVPIDYEPAPQAILNNLRFANRIIAMSKFGQKQLQNSGFSSTYIPHHVDTSIFFPYDKNMDKRKRKMEVKIDPSMFVFGMVSANKDLVSRKSYQQVLQAFKMFLEKHPKSLLYIHTNPDQPGGFPIRNYAEHLGITGNVGYPEKYKMQFDSPKSEMNMIYNTFDTYLMPSSTEGFGITAIEAQATGTPVIVNNYTSMPELIQDGKTGFMTKIGHEVYMPIGGYMKFPDIKDLYDKMELTYSSNLVEMGHSAHKWINENYSLEKIWQERWLPFLSRIEFEIYGKPQVLTQSPTTV